MFVEQCFDLLFRREPSRASVIETSLDTSKLFRRCMIFSNGELGIDLKRKIGELGLRRLGPSFDSR